MGCKQEVCVTDGNVLADVVSRFMQGRCALSDFVRTVIGCDMVVDGWLQNPALHAVLHERVGETIARAPCDAGAAYEMHSTLHSLYSMQIAQRGSSQEFSVRLFEIRRLLESAWLNAEFSRCQAEPMPEDPGEFRSWFFAEAEGHPAARHALYDYIGDEISLAGFRTFVSHESTVDARFDDLLALAQLGFTGGKKLEVARNYWDELGAGRPARVHTTMFNRVFDAIGYDEATDPVDLDVTALACGNLLLALASYRSYSNYAIGALGITEALAPYRFEKVLKAGARLGIDARAMEYFREHVRVDVHHTQKWIENVIEPTVQEHPQALGQVCVGVLARLNTSMSYCDALLRQLMSAEDVVCRGARMKEESRLHD
jgi:Iron-containing redox enzyme